MVLQLALVGTALMLPALEMQDTYSLVPILRWVFMRHCNCSVDNHLDISFVKFL